MIRGDIAERRAASLVNAAGTSLRMGSGVAGAPRRNAGGPINEAVVSKGPVDLGAVAVTDAHEATTLTEVRVIAFLTEGFRALESVAERVRSAER